MRDWIIEVLKLAAIMLLLILFGAAFLLLTFLPL